MQIYLEPLEEKAFADKSIWLPKLYVRYIEDVFAIFDNVNDYNKFLKVLNQHQNSIKFSVEKATNSLHYFELELEIANHSVNTCSWVWPKRSNTGAPLHYSAKHPQK